MFYDNQYIKNVGCKAYKSWTRHQGLQQVALMWLYLPGVETPRADWLALS